MGIFMREAIMWRTILRAVLVAAVTVASPAAVGVDGGVPARAKSYFDSQPMCQKDSGFFMVCGFGGHRADV